MLKSGSISVKHLNPEYLKEFRAVKTKVTDIYELKNFRLKTMFLDYQKGLIISIKGMPLETLEIADCQQTSFSELNKNTLKVIRLFQTKGFSSIYSLKGFKLNEFHISEALVDNIFILKDMPIESVSLGNTKVTDLSPLAGKAIKNLILPATCKELDILKTLKSLEKVAIPRDLWTKELGYLRNSKIIIEGYGTKRGWWIDWGLITRKNSDLFWKNFDQYIKSNNK